MRPLRALPEEAQGVRGHGLRRHTAEHELPAARQPRGAAGDFGALPLHNGGRVPGHQLLPIPDTQEAGLRAPQHLRGRRRQPVDLRLPRRQDREHTELPQGLPRLPHIPAGEELPLHLDHSRRSQHAHRPQRRPHPEGMLRGGGGRREDQAAEGLHRTGGGGGHSLRHHREGALRPRPVPRLRRALPHQLPVARRRGAAAPPQHTLHDLFGQLLLRARRSQGHDELFPALHQPGGQRGLPPRGQQARPRNRRGHSERRGGSRPREGAVAVPRRAGGAQGEAVLRHGLASLSPGGVHRRPRHGGAHRRGVRPLRLIQARHLDRGPLANREPRRAAELGRGLRGGAAGGGHGRRRAAGARSRDARVHPRRLCGERLAAEQRGRELRRERRQQGRADDGAFRQGARVPLRVRGRNGGEPLPEHVDDLVGQRRGGGAPAVLRGDDPREEGRGPLLRRHPHAQRQA